jgi:lysyl-tRNA synthetase class 2
VAERYELYLGQVELANGYHELLMPTSNARFARDLSVRSGRGAEEPVMDEALLAALAAGFPIAPAWQ